MWKYEIFLVYLSSKHFFMNTHKKSTKNEVDLWAWRGKRQKPDVQQVFS